MLTYSAQCQCVKPPVYAFFICFLIRVLHLELPIAKKNCYHCTATKFNTYLIMHTPHFGLCIMHQFPRKPPRFEENSMHFEIYALVAYAL